MYVIGREVDDRMGAAVVRSAVVGWVLRTFSEVDDVGSLLDVVVGFSEDVDGVVLIDVVGNAVVVVTVTSTSFDVTVGGGLVDLSSLDVIGLVCVVDGWSSNV